jgi:hypothetical protein
MASGMEVVQGFFLDGVQRQGRQQTIAIADHSAVMVAPCPAAPCLPLFQMAMVWAYLTSRHSLRLHPLHAV